jgi:hypothetical protein
MLEGFESGDTEDGVISTVSLLFSSLLFSLLLYFFRSQPGTNGVGRDF